jgi:hypothetical protein
MRSQRELFDTSIKRTKDPLSIDATLEKVPGEEKDMAIAQAPPSLCEIRPYTHS